LLADGKRDVRRISDRKPSLALRDGDDRRPLVHCHAGRSFQGRPFHLTKGTLAMNYDHDYLPPYFSGNFLNDQLEAEKIKELILTIASITTETFNDTKDRQWVASFGAGMPKLRIKPPIGKPLRQAFGPDSGNWIGKHIGLSVEPIEWEERATGEKKSGFTIKARSVGGDEPTGLPRPPLDDDIPF
jgi:hypothetical protein